MTDAPLLRTERTVTEFKMRVHSCAAGRGTADERYIDVDLKKVFPNIGGICYFKIPAPNALLDADTLRAAADYLDNLTSDYEEVMADDEPATKTFSLDH